MYTHTTCNYTQIIHTHTYTHAPTHARTHLLILLELADKGSEIVVLDTLLNVAGVVLVEHVHLQADGLVYLATKQLPKKEDKRAEKGKPKQEKGKSEGLRAKMLKSALYFFSLSHFLSLLSLCCSSSSLVPLMAH